MGARQAATPLLPPSRRAALGAAILAVAAVTSWVGYLALMTGLTPWDDEGTLLLQLRQYAEGGILYDDLFTTYGPAYFQMFRGVFGAFGLLLDHTSGRLIVLVLWVSSSAVCGLVVSRMTRNLPAALCAQVLTFHGLASLKTEPMHPGGILCLFLGAVVLAGMFVRFESASRSSFLMGSLLGAVALTKVNVGALALLSTMFALLAPATGRWRMFTVAAGFAFVLAPAALLLGARHTGWGLALAAVVSGAAVAVALLILATVRPRPGPPRAAMMVLLAFAAVAAVSCGIEMLRGNSPEGLLRGMLLDPIGFPGLYTLPLHLPPMAVRFSLVSVLLAILVVLSGSRRPADPAAGAGVRGPLLILAGITIWAVGVTWRAQMHYVASLPLLWMILGLAAPEKDGDPKLGRPLLLAIAILQTLHAYPVASSQIYFSTFLLIPAGALAVSDGWRLLGGSSGFLVAAGARGRAVSGTAGALILMVLVFWVALVQPWRAFKEAYDAGVPLGLRGAEGIRVPESTRNVYQELVGHLSQRCGTFLTLPGLNSLYLFSGIEPPTRINVGGVILLSDSQQRQIRDRVSLMADPVCAVRNQPLVDFWARGQDLSRKPLVKYLDEAFVKEAQFGSYELLVRKRGVSGGEHRRDGASELRAAPGNIPGGS